MDILDKIYYINLVRRPERNTHFVNQYLQAELPINKLERFNAIDGSHYTFTDEELHLFRHVDYKNKKHNTNIYGNQLSHHYILKEMIKHNYKYILICQDDTIFCKNFVEHLNNVLNNIPSDAEIINIGTHKFACFDYFEKWNLENTLEQDYAMIGSSSVNEYVCKCNRNHNPCSLAYIVTLKGAIAYTELKEYAGFCTSTDGDYNTYLYFKKINYISKKVLCTGESDFKSDIFVNNEFDQVKHNFKNDINLNLNDNKNNE